MTKSSNDAFLRMYPHCKVTQDCSDIFKLSSPGVHPASCSIDFGDISFR